ncbi:hypothetical protein KCU66_g35, partial [Aureobasidium melanogenum]
MRHANFPIDGSLANRDVDGACRDKTSCDLSPLSLHLAAIQILLYDIFWILISRATQTMIIPLRICYLNRAMIVQRSSALAPKMSTHALHIGTLIWVSLKVTWETMVARISSLKRNVMG